MPRTTPPPCYLVGTYRIHERYICCRCNYTTYTSYRVGLHESGPEMHIAEEHLRRFCGFRVCRHRADACPECLRTFWQGYEKWMCWACDALTNAWSTRCRKCDMERVAGTPMGILEKRNWRYRWLKRLERLEGIPDTSSEEEAEEEEEKEKEEEDNEEEEDEKDDEKENEEDDGDEDEEDDIRVRKRIKRA